LVRICFCLLATATPIACARLLHKHWMFQITRALALALDQIRRIPGDGLHSDTDDILYYRSALNAWQFCIKHPRRQRNQVYKRIQFSRLPARTVQMIFIYGGRLLSPEVGN
jgi:hypothetical protein